MAQLDALDAIRAELALTEGRDDNFAAIQVVQDGGSSAIRNDNVVVRVEGGESRLYSLSRRIWVVRLQAEVNLSGQTRQGRTLAVVDRVLRAVTTMETTVGGTTYRPYVPGSAQSGAEDILKGAKANILSWSQRYYEPIVGVS